MARKHLNQYGFEAMGVLVAVVIVAAIGLVGYKVVTLQNADKQQAAVTTSADVSEPEQIKTRADLSTTSKSLDKESTELNSGLNDGSLDADVNALL